MTKPLLTDGGSGHANRSKHFTYDISANEAPSEAVVKAVASLTNMSVLELDPLYDVIDPDALDELFGNEDDRAARRGRSLTIVFNDCEVTVTCDELRVGAIESATDR